MWRCNNIILFRHQRQIPVAGRSTVQVSCVTGSNRCFTYRSLWCCSSPSQGKADCNTASFYDRLSIEFWRHRNFSSMNSRTGVKLTGLVCPEFAEHKTTLFCRRKVGKMSRSMTTCCPSRSFAHRDLYEYS